MSYDVTVGGDWHNMTTNLRRFFRAFDVDPVDWDGVNRFDVADRIDTALDRIARSDVIALRQEYDAPNGWGTVEDGIGFLEAVRKSCRYEVPSTVSVNW